MTTPARENPFRVERVHSIPFIFSEHNLQYFLQNIQKRDFRGAIVGPHGSGKTTLVECLLKEFQKQQIPYAHCRLIDDGRQANRQRIKNWLQNATSDSVLILDSAGLLGWRDWRNLKKQSANYTGLIITTHRAGRLPTLIECHPQLETLFSIINQLELVSPPSKSRLEKLFQRHKGNIRDCLRELYELYSKY